MDEIFNATLFKDYVNTIQTQNKRFNNDSYADLTQLGRLLSSADVLSKEQAKAFKLYIEKYKASRTSAINGDGSLSDDQRNKQLDDLNQRLDKLDNTLTQLNALVKEGESTFKDFTGVTSAGKLSKANPISQVLTSMNNNITNLENSINQKSKKKEDASAEYTALEDMSQKYVTTALNLKGVIEKIEAEAAGASGATIARSMQHISKNFQAADNLISMALKKYTYHGNTPLTSKSARDFAKGEDIDITATAQNIIYLKKLINQGLIGNKAPQNDKDDSIGWVNAIRDALVDNYNDGFGNNDLSKIAELDITTQYSGDKNQLYKVLKQAMDFYNADLTAIKKMVGIGRDKIAEQKGWEVIYHLTDNLIDFLDNNLEPYLQNSHSGNKNVAISYKAEKSKALPYFLKKRSELTNLANNGIGLTDRDSSLREELLQKSNEFVDNLLQYTTDGVSQLAGQYKIIPKEEKTKYRTAIKKVDSVLNPIRGKNVKYDYAKIEANFHDKSEKFLLNTVDQMVAYAKNYQEDMSPDTLYKGNIKYKDMASIDVEDNLKDLVSFGISYFGPDKKLAKENYLIAYNDPDKFKRVFIDELTNTTEKFKPYRQRFIDTLGLKQGTDPYQDAAVIAQDLADIYLNQVRSNPVVDASKIKFIDAPRLKTLLEGYKAYIGQNAGTDQEKIKAYLEENGIQMSEGIIEAFKNMYDTYTLGQEGQNKDYGPFNSKMSGARTLEAKVERYVGAEARNVFERYAHISSEDALHTFEVAIGERAAGESIHKIVTQLAEEAMKNNTDLDETTAYKWASNQTGIILDYIKTGMSATDIKNRLTYTPAQKNLYHQAITAASPELSNLLEQIPVVKPQTELNKRLGIKESAFGVGTQRGLIQDIITEATQNGHIVDVKLGTDKSGNNIIDLYLVKQDEWDAITGQNLSEEERTKLLDEKSNIDNTGVIKIRANYADANNLLNSGNSTTLDPTVVSMYQKGYVGSVVEAFAMIKHILHAHYGQDNTDEDKKTNAQMSYSLTRIGTKMRDAVGGTYTGNKLYDEINKNITYNDSMTESEWLMKYIQSRIGSLASHFFRENLIEIERARKNTKTPAYRSDKEIDPFKLNDEDMVFFETLLQDIQDGINPLYDEDKKSLFNAKYGDIAAMLEKTPAFKSWVYNLTSLHKSGVNFFGEAESEQSFIKGKQNMVHADMIANSMRGLHGLHAEENIRKAYVNKGTMERMSQDVSGLLVKKWMKPLLGRGLIASGQEASVEELWGNILAVPTEALDYLSQNFIKQYGQNQGYTQQQIDELTNELTGSIGADSVMLFQDTMEDLAIKGNYQYSDEISFDELKKRADLKKLFGLNNTSIDKLVESAGETLPIVEQFKSSNISAIKGLTVTPDMILDRAKVSETGITFGARTKMTPDNGYKGIVGLSRKSVENPFQHFDKDGSIQKEFENYILEKLAESFGVDKSVLENLGIKGIIASEDVSTLGNVRKSTDYFIGRENAIVSTYLYDKNGKYLNRRFNMLKDRFANYTNKDKSKENAVHRVGDFLVNDILHNIGMDSNGNAVNATTGKTILGDNQNEIETVWAYANTPEFWDDIIKHLFTNIDDPRKKLLLSDSLRSVPINLKRETVNNSGSFATNDVSSTRNKNMKEGGVRAARYISERLKEALDISYDERVSTYQTKYGTTKEEAQKIIAAADEYRKKRFQAESTQSIKAKYRYNAVNDALNDLSHKTRENYTETQLQGIPTIKFIYGSGNDTDIDNGIIDLNEGLLDVKKGQKLSEDDAKLFALNKAKAAAFKIAQARGIDPGQVRYEFSASNLSDDQQSKLGVLGKRSFLLPMYTQLEKAADLLNPKTHEYKVTGNDSSISKLLSLIQGHIARDEGTPITQSELNAVLDEINPTIQKDSDLFKEAYKNTLAQSFVPKDASSRYATTHRMSSDILHDMLTAASNSSVKSRAMVYRGNLQLYKYLSSKHGQDAEFGLDKISQTTEAAAATSDNEDEVNNFITQAEKDQSQLDRLNKELTDALTKYIVANHIKIPVNLLRNPVNSFDQMLSAFVEFSDKLGNYAIYTSKAFNLMQKADQDGDEIEGVVTNAISYDMEKYKNFEDRYKVAELEAEKTEEIYKNIWSAYTYRTQNGQSDEEKALEKKYDKYAADHNYNEFAKKLNRNNWMRSHKTYSEEAKANAAFANDAFKNDITTFLSRTSNQKVGINTYNMEKVEDWITAYFQNMGMSINESSKGAGAGAVLMDAFRPAINEIVKEAPIASKKIMEKLKGKNSDNLIGNIMTLDSDSLITQLNSGVIDTWYSKFPDAFSGNKVLSYLNAYKVLNPKKYQELLPYIDTDDNGNPIGLNQKGWDLFTKQYQVIRQNISQNPEKYFTPAQKTQETLGLNSPVNSASAFKNKVTDETLAEAEAAKSAGDAVQSAMDKATEAEKSKAAQSVKTTEQLTEETAAAANLDGKVIDLGFKFTGEDDLNKFIKGIDNVNSVSYNDTEIGFNGTNHEYRGLSGYINNKHFNSATGIESKIGANGFTFNESQILDYMLKTGGYVNKDDENFKAQFISDEARNDFLTRATSAIRGSFEHVFHDIFAKSGKTVQDLLVKEANGKTFAENFVNGIVANKNGILSEGSNISKYKGINVDAGQIADIKNFRTVLENFSGIPFDQLMKTITANDVNYLQNMDKLKYQFTDLSEVYGATSITGEINGVQHTFDIAGTGDQIVYNPNTKSFIYIDSKGYTSKYGHGFQAMLQEKLFGDEGSGFKKKLKEDTRFVKTGANDKNSNHLYTQEEWNRIVDNASINSMIAEQTDTGSFFRLIEGLPDTSTKTGKDALTRNLFALAALAENGGVPQELLKTGALQGLGFGKLSPNIGVENHQDWQISSADLETAQKYVETYKELRKLIAQINIETEKGPEADLDRLSYLRVLKGAKQNEVDAFGYDPYHQTLGGNRLTDDKGNINEVGALIETGTAVARNEAKNLENGAREKQAEAQANAKAVAAKELVKIYEEWAKAEARIYEIEQLISTQDERSVQYTEEELKALEAETQELTAQNDARNKRLQSDDFKELRNTPVEDEAVNKAGIILEQETKKVDERINGGKLAAQKAEAAQQLVYNKTVESAIALLKQEYAIEEKIQNLKYGKKPVTDYEAQQRNAEIMYLENAKAQVSSQRTSKMKGIIDASNAGDKNAEAALKSYQDKTSVLDYTHKATIASISEVTKQGQGILERIIGGFKQQMIWMIDRSLAYQAFGKIRQVIQNVITQASNLDQALVNIQIATGNTRAETRSLLNEYNKLADELGRTTQEVASASNDWLRAGYDGEEAAELTRASMELSTLGMIESSQATTYLISTLKGWKLQASEVLNVVDKLTVTICGVCLVMGIEYKFNCR